MNQQEALIKLATIRMAINHVLRTRAMEKQARDPDWARNLELTNETNGAVGISTPQWVRGMGGTLNKSRTIERYPKPEKSPTSYFFPFGGQVRETQNKTKRMLKRQEEARGSEKDPYEKYKNPH